MEPQFSDANHGKVCLKSGLRGYDSMKFIMTSTNLLRKGNAPHQTITDKCLAKARLDLMFVNSLKSFSGTGVITERRLSL
jgi:hypothetical protein